MARILLLSLSLSLLFLFHGSFASRELWQLQQDICQINSLDSLEPDRRIECEGGVIESWDPNHEQLQCAGVSILRKIIEPNGLLLPSYSNAAQLIYIVQGKGLTGILLSGCPETFQESQESFQGGQGQGGFEDLHQKIRRFRQGDIIALPAGVSHWCYNDGNEPVVAVSLLDTTNSDNQLDFQPRSFYLAGNPEEEFRQLVERRSRFGKRSEHFRKEGEEGKCNMFCGFDARILAEAFNVEDQLARRLQCENDGRANIIRVEGGLEVVRPPRYSEERERREEERERERERRYRRGRYNGLEETLCTMRFRENIEDPEGADVFTPEAGRLRAVNSNNLPVLSWLQLSAERGVLYSDGLMLPHWNLNAHSIMYVISGQARVQVVDQEGKNVFDGQVQQGQVLVIPQNFAVVKKCESDRFEWVSFKTNDNAVINPLAGKTSVIRALPIEVLANAFQINLEEARRLKFGRHEATLASARSSQSGRYADT